ncbi:MAG: hypothetical protein ACLTZI_13940 [[Eubacterium] siraeum]
MKVTFRPDYDDASSKDDTSKDDNTSGGDTHRQNPFPKQRHHRNRNAA